MPSCVSYNNENEIYAFFKLPVFNLRVFRKIILQKSLLIGKLYIFPALSPLFLGHLLFGPSDCGGGGGRTNRQSYMLGPFGPGN